MIEPLEKSIRLLLMYFGLIPFLMLSYCLLHHEQTIIDPAIATLALSSYSSIILSFLAGCLWKESSMVLIILSNVLALTAWGALLMPFPPWLLLIACFIFMLLVDYGFQTIHYSLRWHRTLITVVVVLCLGSLSLTH